MTSEAHSVAFDSAPTLPSMGHGEWLGYSGDFSSFGAQFPGGYGFESKAFSTFPPLQSQQAIPVNVNRAEVDSTGDSKGPPTPASAASATSQGEERHDSSPASNGNAGYRPWEQAADSYTEEKSPTPAKNPPTSSTNEPFHNGPTPSEDSTSSTQASSDQRPPSGFKASSQTPSPYGSDGNFRSATAEADTTTTELRPVVPDFQVAAVTSSTPLSRPPSQIQTHTLASLEPLQPLQPLQALPPLQQLQVPVTMAMQGQSWTQELASPQALPMSMSVQLGQIPGQHLLLQHPQQHSPVQSLNQPGQATPIRQLSTPPTPTQMVPPSSSPGITEVSGSLERQQQKKKRKRCGECPGCLKKDNCGECGPCRSVRSHQICKMRRCDTLVKTKKDKAPAQPRQKKTDGPKAKGNAKNARTNGQDAPMGMPGGLSGPPLKRHRATPDENKNLHQLTTDIKSQFGLLNNPTNGMYVHHDPSMPPPHMTGYPAGVPAPTATFAPNGQALFNDPNQYVSAPAPAYGHAPMTSHAPAPPMALPAFQPPPPEDFNQQRHQLMNSRLKTLIQQRASQKEPEQNSQDGFRSPAQTPTTPTSGSPPDFSYATVSQPEWAVSNGQGQHATVVKMESSDTSQDTANSAAQQQQQQQQQAAAAPSPSSEFGGQKASETLERPPSNQSVGRQTPQSQNYPPQTSFGSSPKTAFQTPGSNGQYIPAQSPHRQFDESQSSSQQQQQQDRTIVVSTAQQQQTFLLNSTGPVASYANIVTYTSPATAYDPQAAVGFPPKASFYQGAPQFAALPPADVMTGSLYGTTNGFGAGPLPSMGTGFGVSALPPMHSAGPQATTLNLPGTDPWWERLERLKAHEQTAEERTEYSGQTM